MKYELRLVRNFTEATAITHSGVFHADEVFATVLLCNMHPVKLFRTASVTSEDSSFHQTVYDIGGGKYDHHQKTFNDCRASGTKYSSFGLMWKECGIWYMSHEVNTCKNPELAAEIFDREFVEGIDAIDNGQIIKHVDEVSITSVSNIISMMNPLWNKSEEDENDCFEKAVKVANVIFNRAIESAVSKAEAKDIVEAAIERSNDHIMILDFFVPWQSYLLNSENPKAADILYVLFTSKRSGFNVQAVPDAPGSFGMRKMLPKAWAGLNKEELVKVTGVESAIFCHNARFICGAKKYNDALELAKLAVND